MNEYCLVYGVKCKYCMDEVPTWMWTSDLFVSSINIESNVLLTYLKVYEQIKLSIIVYFNSYPILLNIYCIFENIQFQIYNKINNQIVLEYIIDAPNKLKFDIDVTKPFQLRRLIENII